MPSFYSFLPTIPSANMPFMAPHVKAARLHLQKADPIMKRLIKVHGPFTAKAQVDRFGTLADSIVSQQISTAAARTIKNRIREAVIQRSKTQLGSTSSAQGFSAEGLLLFSVEELQPLGVSRQKAGYLLDLADKIKSEEIHLKQMHKRDDQQVIDELTKVRGIGTWTAQMFLIFSLARLDVLPVDDLGLKKAIKKEYQLAQIPTPNQILEIAQPWRPYATVASWYLWRSVDNDDSWS